MTIDAPIAVGLPLEPRDASECPTIPFAAGTFEARIVLESDRNLLIIGGEIDHAAVSHLELLHRLLLIDDRPIVVDCSAVSFMDSGGVSFVLEVLARRSQDWIENPTWSVVRLLRALRREDLLLTRTRRTQGPTVHEGTSS